MARIYVPSGGPHDWQWLLARPGRQFKHGASAMALADTWEAADPWPGEVAAALGAAGFPDLELLLALPEHQTPLPGGAAASQTDLLVLARRPRRGSRVVLAVEGKAAEPFGEHTVAQWRRADTPGRRQRLAFLLELLGLPDDDATGTLRYQLLHRAASALLEADRFGAREAILLVHSFSREHAWFDDYAAFAGALRARPAREAITPARVPGDVALHLGWVSAAAPPARTGEPLGHRFDHAVSMARRLHAAQRRKGTAIPYVAHLLAVAALVVEDGGSEDEAIAALLHDAVEDQGGRTALRAIDHAFGPEVARIVLACSDADVEPKPPWRARKEAYVTHLADADASVLRVSLADKLHNARAILFDLTTAGPAVWSRFNAGRDEVLWYYGALADAFDARDAGPMARELRRTVEALRAATGGQGDAVADAEP